MGHKNKKSNQCNHTVNLQNFNGGTFSLNRENVTEKIYGSVHIKYIKMKINVFFINLLTLKNKLRL